MNPRVALTLLQLSKLIAGVVLLILGKDATAIAAGGALIGSAQGSLEPQPWKRKYSSARPFPRG